MKMVMQIVELSNMTGYLLVLSDCTLVFSHRTCPLTSIIIANPKH